MNSAMQNNDELRELYRELILDHAKSPRHFGTLDDATHGADGVNPLCGDKLKLYLRLDADNRITDAAFEGTGCAISVASASLLTDAVIGMDGDTALEFARRLIEALKGEAAHEDIDFGKLRALEGVREFPSRVKCATLAWHAMRSAMRNGGRPVSTE